MKKYFLIFISVVFASCSSNPDKFRTRFTDKNMRLMIDPASITTDNYVRLQTALVQTEMWTVLDRKSGLKAIKKEQEDLHKVEADRYSDKEKFAHWGKLYGVGAVVVGHTQCFYKKSVWKPQGQYTCDLLINLVDANTGEVVLGVEDSQQTDGPSVAPDWKNVVEKLADAYPKTFERVPSSERLETYKLESEESAKRTQEMLEGKK